METRGYSDEQIEKLLENMPAVMAALLRVKDDGEAADLFHRLDDWCWHVPSCEKGEICLAGEPNEAQQKQLEEEARNWHIRRDERNGRHTP